MMMVLDCNLTHPDIELWTTRNVTLQNSYKNYSQSCDAFLLKQTKLTKTQI
jgi:hypothetical protein